MSGANLIEPSHGVGEIDDGLRQRRRRAPQHRHRQAQHSRRFNFGGCRLGAAIFRDQDFDALGAHQFNFFAQIKRPPRLNETHIAQQRHLRRWINGAQEVAMLRRLGEGAQMQAPKGQEHASRRGAKRGDRAFGVIDLAPIIVGLAQPGRAREDQQRNARAGAGLKRMARHLRGEWMRRVDDGADALLAQIVAQAGDAAKAANTHRQRRGRRITRRSGQRQNAGKIGAPRQRRAQEARLR